MKPHAPLLAKLCLPLLAPALALGAASAQAAHAKRPNILLIMCDQYRFPRFSGPEGGFPPELDNILGFQGEVDGSNPFAQFFPGLIRLRRDAVVLRNHTIAASACTQSALAGEQTMTAGCASPRK